MTKILDSIHVENVRIIYPYIDKVQPLDDVVEDLWKYSGTFLLSKEEHKDQIKEIYVKVRDFAKNEGKIWTGALPTETETDNPNFVNRHACAFRNGDLPNPKDKVVGHFKDHWYLVARNKNRPQVFDDDMKVIEDESEMKRLFRAGNRVCAHLSPWVFYVKDAGEWKIGFTLHGIQFWGEDEEFKPEPIDTTHTFRAKSKTKKTMKVKQEEDAEKEAKEVEDDIPF